MGKQITIYNFFFHNSRRSELFNRITTSTWKGSLRPKKAVASKLRLRPRCSEPEGEPVNIPSLSSQSQRAKNTIHCFRSLKRYLISGLISVYTSWLVFWSEFFRHLKWRNLSIILLFFARLYLFSTFLLISHSSIENTFILGGDRQLAGWWPCRHSP